MAGQAPTEVRWRVTAPVTAPADRAVPLLAPLRHRAYAVLWGGVAAAFLAQWMIPVAAQWYLVSAPGGAPLVPLVQAAISLPMALGAVPAGVLADNFDRRRMVVVVQAIALVAEMMLVALTVLGLLVPVALFALLAILSCSIAFTYTPLSSMIPDLVDRESIPPAAALLAIATNSTRIVGPALSGVVIGFAGVQAGFAASVPPTAALIVVMSRWRPRRRSRLATRERFMPAVRSGFHFVRHSPQALKLTVRALWFTAGVVGLISLLPLVATRLGAGSAQLGLLLAGQGVGAVLGAVTLPSMHRATTLNGIVAVGFVVAGGALLGVALTGRLLMVGVFSVAAGWAWTTALATIQAAMQMYLPAWVRSRGLAILLVATYGGQAAGALGLGAVANGVDTRSGLFAGAAVLLAGAGLAVWWPLKDLPDVDRSRASSWHSPELLVDPHELGGQVQVRVSYTVPADRQDDYLAAMHVLRRVRLRTGAIRWQMLRHAGIPDRFIEEFTVGSWAEYEQQMLDRAVVYDRQLEARAASFSTTGVETHYLLRMETADQ